MIKKIVFKIFFTVWALVICSCKSQFSSQVYSEQLIVESSKYSSLGFKAFRSGFYTFTQTQGCVKCHDTNVSPNFASLNIDTAYENALGYKIGSSNSLIDFNDPDNSTFVEYAGNAHCSDLPCSDVSVRDKVKKLLEDWATAENAANGGGHVEPLPAYLKFLTSSLQVPMNIPTIFASTPGVMRFNLGNLVPTVAGLENAILEIEIQMISTNIYKINKPRVLGGTRAVQFTNLTVLIKSVADETVVGVEDTSYTSNWHSVSKSAAIFALPATLPVGPTTATPLVDSPLYYVTDTKADYLRIGFENIQ